MLNIGWLGGGGGRISKIHMLQQKFITIGGLDIMAAENYPQGLVLSPHIRMKNIPQTHLDNLERVWDIYKVNFRDFCNWYIEDFDDPEDAADFSSVPAFLEYGFGYTGAELDDAMLYFITYLVRRGLVPMTYLNEELFFAPEYRYGIKPQEIIDNIMAEWKRRGRGNFEFLELYLGLEPYCGGFYPDSPELSGAADD
jgi:hypothetical protein